MKQELITLVWERVANRCEYCRFPNQFAWLPFQIDHIIAEKHSGLSVAENLALSGYY
jgi:5-methylcytosine-specific restriction protein A